MTAARSGHADAVKTLIGGARRASVGLVFARGEADELRFVMIEPSRCHNTIAFEPLSAFGLAGAKVVAGRRMTTHPAFVNQLAAMGADVINPDWGARVVDEDGIVSCGGVTSGIDEALYLIETLWPQDPQLVADVRSYIDYPYRAATMSALAPSSASRSAEKRYG